MNPYDRKVIVTGDFPEIRHVRPGEKNESQGILGANSATKAGAAAGAAAGAFFGPIGIAVGGIAGGLIGRSRQQNAEVQQPGLDYVEVPISIAHRELSWSSPDHLRKNGVYSQSPRNPEMYFPAEKFHAVAFEDKYTEALRVLMALRPRTLIVEHETGYEAELVVGAELNAISKAGKMKVEGGYNKTDNKKVVFQGNFEKPGMLDRFKKKELPADLNWYPYEGKWRSIVEGVWENGLKKVDMEVTYYEDFGFNAEFEGSLRLIGLKLDADYQQFKKTLWRIRGEFW
jgi:hypothetical protein